MAKKAFLQITASDFVLHMDRHDIKIPVARKALYEEKSLQIFTIANQPDIVL